ncbi:hypothetical protein [Fodinibius salsisoli]|uniref:Copper chaperone CopZ n=1 Tax=Fodinibius salsisoli TaxID=2820877 RepID=A0ABT3PI10_9BACT|nr:hypothetical protein [Fodinibius salsisoli]MCW9705535.1 hypothetical protein [Fodinibius salsisoli]
MERIGVYQTDVNDLSEADSILDEIRHRLPGSDASFDLDDCDNVLRIEYNAPEADSTKVVSILEDNGYQINPLP